MCNQHKSKIFTNLRVTLNLHLNRCQLYKHNLLAVIGKNNFNKCGPMTSVLKSTFE